MSRARVLIAGGGVAGLEALLALCDLAGDRAELTLLSPDPEFVYRPLLVEEPFGSDPVERHELAPLVSELGARFVLGALRSVWASKHGVVLADGSTLPYDYLVVCAGGRLRPAVPGAETFPSEQVLRADELVARAQAHEGRLVFIVPPGVTWSLPLYELALMTQSRASSERAAVKIAIVTPESAPLNVFGAEASAAVSELLRARGIRFVGSSTVRDVSGHGLRLMPGDRALSPSAVVALAAMDGPSIEGLPADERGFIPIDRHARVPGVADVYAAGDGTIFPVKQGGLGAQQADAAAEHIAHRLGAPTSPEPFRPMLRGKLLTGDESLHIRSDPAGGGGGAEVSPGCLWWPPHKISARYLSPLLYHGGAHHESEPPVRSLDVELETPKEWHEEPMALDPRR